MLDISVLAMQSPATIGEALVCMERTLDFFHERNDDRAVFLRAYYIITCNVRDGIERRGRFRNADFWDPPWMSSLAGKFATLYFRSLTTFERSEHQERSWKLTHRLAMHKQSSVIQDLLLGIVTHIKYDLAVALYRNIREHRDDLDPARLRVRKRDHDYANQFLRLSMTQIIADLTCDYGGLLRCVDLASLRLARSLAMLLIRGYRERVWEYALELLATKTSQEYDRVLDEIDSWSIATTARISSNGRQLPQAMQSLMRSRRIDISHVRVKRRSQPTTTVERGLETP